MTLFASLYRVFAKRPAVLVAASLALVLASGFAATRFVVREDVTTLMPARPAVLAEQFAILREAPLLQGLTITLGGPDPARAAAVLADALRGPDIPQVFSGAATGFSPETLTRLCAASPGLMNREQLAALPGLVTEDAMRGALARDARLLMTPKGLALRDMLAMDPLGICGNALRGLAPGGFAGAGAGPRMESGSLKLDSGYLASADGKYAMVLAEPAASVGDSRSSAAVMDKVRKAIRLLPEGTEVLVAGGHRHTEANAAVIQKDMARVLPLSLVFLVVFFLLFVRSWQGMAIFVLPTASLAVAAACTGIFYGSLSGIVLGFGSVVLGITADYAIHVYYAVRTGGDVAESLARVSRPLLLGAATTLAGFAAFFASSIPCILQMTVFAISGVLAAVLLALVVLPQCLRPGAATPPAVTESGAAVCRPSRLLAGAWIAMALILPALLYTVPVNGDVRALSYTPRDIAADEARTGEIWGGLRNNAMFAVSGDTLDEALEKNDRLWRDLSLLPAGSGFGAGAITSLAPFLPSAKTQAERHAVWTAFWRERGPDVLASLARLAPEAGFSDGAFAPFAAWIASEPETITPETLTRLGLPLPLLFIRQTSGQPSGQPSGQTVEKAGGTSYVYSLIPSDAPSRPFLDTLERGGATYVSGQTFRDALAAATRDDMRRFGALALAAILGMAAFVLRSPSRMGVALLPVALGLAAVLGVFRLSGLSLNIFHAMALPLIMALSVDYGVFMLARQEGVLDSDSRKGVLLSGLTTLSGFGSLLLAKHPALFSLGMTVTLGLAASLSAALWLVPRLVSPTQDGVKTGGTGGETHG
ncbi:putative Exporter protein [uncultured delta proteobacterium]|uniref:Putative Exporter protein n=1 Tax=uncultured delta proteobacterium TaxID=34034 RepID=A0A212JFM9_9DELT|nr:putative Exporter protein [uncultured delta proteobacterium]